MAKLQPLEDKDFDARKPYFGLGAHEVYIKAARRGQLDNENKTEYVEFDLLGEDDQEGNVRLWISEKAAPYTLARLGQIAVHNKDTEEEKQKVRDAFKKITDTDLIDQKFLDKFKDMQAWILVEEDTNAPKPNGGFYTRTNLYSYPPKPRQLSASDLTTDQMKQGGTPVNPDEVPFE